MAQFQPEQNQKPKYDPFKSPAEMRNPVLFWIHKNLFSSVLNTGLTLLFIYLIFILLKDAVIPLFTWDWSVIKANLTLILAGSYAPDQLWRIWFCLCYTAVFGGLSFGLSAKRPPSVMYIIGGAAVLLSFLPFRAVSRIGLLLAAALLFIAFYLPVLLPKVFPRQRRVVTIIAGWVLLLPVAFIMVRGFGGPMPIVKANHWGGLLLSLLITLTCIFFSFPLGLFLALGRRSKLLMVKSICIFFIEVIRGVPLVTILFVGYLILPMALPQGLSPSVFARALTGMVMFHAAYMAEAFRGGFQGISRTQYEAASSLNLSPAKTMIFVILPQVLKRLIPVLVNQFTSTLKDTSLISIIGMLDLIGISTSIVSNPKYLTGSAQVLLFEGLIYFVLCFSISKSSMSLEKKLGVASKIPGN